MLDKIKAIYSNKIRSISRAKDATAAVKGALH